MLKTLQIQVQGKGILAHAKAQNIMCRMNKAEATLLNAKQDHPLRPTVSKELTSSMTQMLVRSLQFGLRAVY